MCAKYYFAIDEKQNSIDMTENGREELASGSSEGKDYFVLPDLSDGIGQIDNDSSASFEDKAKRKDALYHLYGERSDRIHTLNQLLKAYTLFAKDDQYVITEDGKIAIVDSGMCRLIMSTVPLTIASQPRL